MRTGENNLLPKDDDTTEEIAGDVRAIEMPGLATMHTLFVREHNRICDLIAAQEPGLDEDYYFENARRIVIAEMQNIVYGEYLPVVLGEDAIKDGKLGKYFLQQYGLSKYPPITNHGNWSEHCAAGA